MLVSVSPPLGFGGGARECPHADDIDAKDVSSVPRWRQLCPQLHVKLHSRFAHRRCCSFGHSFHILIIYKPAICALPCLCCAHAPAQVRLEQPGLALLNTFLPPQSASYTRRERRPSHAPRLSFPESAFLPQHASNLAHQHRRKATLRLKHQNRDSTATKCLPMSSHSHAMSARRAHRTDCRSKDTTRGPS